MRKYFLQCCLNSLPYSVRGFVIAGFFLGRGVLRHIRRAVRLQRLLMSRGSPVGQSPSLIITVTLNAIQIFAQNFVVNESYIAV